MQRRCATCNGHNVLNIGGRIHTCPTCEGAGFTQPTPARVLRDYFVTVLVPASGSNTGSIQILTDADFEWVFSMYQSTSNLLSVTVTDSSTGRVLTPTNNPNVGAIPIALWAGNSAGLPFPLLEPYIIARNGVMNFVFTDTSGAPNTVTIVLSGFSLFPQDAMEQGSAGHISRPNAA